VTTMIELLVRRTRAVLSSLSREEGQALVEYTLVLALVVIGAIAVLKGIGVQTSGMLSKISSDFP